MRPTILRTLTSAALAAIALSAGVPRTMAQSDPSVCTGKARINTIYSNIVSNGRTATVEYHMQIMNASNASISPQLMLRNFDPKVQLTPLIQVGALRAYETRNLVLGRFNANNASGSGAPILNPGNVSIIYGTEQPRANMPVIYVRHCIQ